MEYIEAPNVYEGNSPALFLAGGISDAENWQLKFIELIPYAEFAILNPRRASFPVGDPDAKVQQIEWEHRHMQRADLVAFWFPPQTLCPIALFELGACCAARKAMVVGTDPGYARRSDLETHLRLRRPDVRIVNSLEALAGQAVEHFQMERTTHECPVAD